MSDLQVSRRRWGKTELSIPVFPLVRRGLAIILAL